MDVFLWFWAKLGSSTWPEQYHPVLCHLIDVGQVTRQLWHAVLRPKLRAWVTSRLGLIDQAAAGAWLAFWAAAHDIGKLTPCFQAKGKSDDLIARLRQARFDFPCGTRPHGDLSTTILADLLAALDPRAEPAR